MQQGVIFFADDGSISRESLEKSVQLYNNGVEQQSLGRNLIFIIGYYCSIGY